jgi:hypothetical protein
MENSNGENINVNLKRDSHSHRLPDHMTDISYDNYE